MSDDPLLVRIHTMVESLHNDWFGNGQEGYRAKVVRHDERIEALEDRLDTACATASKKATAASLVTAVIAAIGTVFTKDKVGG